VGKVILRLRSRQSNIIQVEYKKTNTYGVGQVFVAAS
jgi:hypothetical protein